MRTCTVPGCGKKHEAKGLCANHYQNSRPKAEEARQVKGRVRADLLRGKNRKAIVGKVLVEGKYVTYAEIGEAIGKSHEQARNRYAWQQRKGAWPITWEMLGAQES